MPMGGVPTGGMMPGLGMGMPAGMGAPMGTPMLPWGCQYMEVADPSHGSHGMEGEPLRVVEPVRVVDDRGHRGAPTEIVREVPYEIVREVTKEVPIEVTREVPAWRRDDFERQIDERKERRKGDQYAAHPRAFRLADRAADHRADPAAGRHGAYLPPGGPRVAPGYKVWDPARAHAAGAKADLPRPRPGARNRY